MAGLTALTIYYREHQRDFHEGYPLHMRPRFSFRHNRTKQENDRPKRLSKLTKTISHNSQKKTKQERKMLVLRMLLSGVAF